MCDLACHILPSDATGGSLVEIVEEKDGCEATEHLMFPLLLSQISVPIDMTQ